MSPESLGEIKTDGEFREADPDNMLKYEGCYKGLDYVTLVFDDSSPITRENAELFITGEEWINSDLEGVLYQEKGGRKYVEYAFRTRSNIKGGKSEQSDTVNIARSFKLPIKEDEPMTYYRVVIAPTKGINYFNACVEKCTQTGVIECSDWTDYTYDVERECYYEDSGKWEREDEKDLKTDNMPLE